MLRPAEHGRLAAEADKALRFARLVKLFDLGPERFLFRFKSTDGETLHLLVALDGPWPRVMLLDGRPEVPRKPSPLAEILRRQLKNARVEGLAVQDEDRILRMTLRASGKDGPEERALVCEMLPRFRNLLVLDGKERIQVLLRELAEPRVLKPGEIYAPPEKPNSADSSSDPAFAFLEGESGEGTSLSQRFEAWVTPREFEGEFERNRNELVQQLRKLFTKEERLRGKIARDLEGNQRADQLRWRGELLKSSLDQVKRGATQVKAQDYESGDEVVIPLDPKLGPRENVEALFKRARKAERAVPILETRLLECDERVERAREQLAAMEAADSTEVLRKLEAAAIQAGLLPRRKTDSTPSRKKGETPAARLPYRRYWTRDGWEILVGRTARDNDELTFKVARGNDYWFHVAGSPGSHVIARGKGEIPPETLLDAAMLALKASRAGKSGGKHEVSWTQRKWVSKFRGANTGQVQLARRKTLLVRLEEDRLQALKDRPPPPDRVDPGGRGA